MIRINDSYIRFYCEMPKHKILLLYMGGLNSVPKMYQLVAKAVEKKLLQI